MRHGECTPCIIVPDFVVLIPEKNGLANDGYEKQQPLNTIFNACLKKSKPYLYS